MAAFVPRLSYDKRYKDNHVKIFFEKRKILKHDTAINGYLD